MKITLELPDWVNGKHLYVLAGIELVAYKYLDTEWQIKTSRCNFCGECCENFSDLANTEGIDKNGVCVHLKKDGYKKICSLGSRRSFGCCVGTSKLKNCTEKYGKMLPL